MDLTPVTLEGVHVRLVPLSLDHVDALWAVGTDAEIWTWTTAQPRAPGELRMYVETALRWQAEGTALPFATTLKGDGRVVGSTRFANTDHENRRTEIGWTWIGLPWQRTRVNTEAKYLMLRHAFEVLRCIRVELKTDALNVRSRRAIARIGAKEEGTLRNHMIAPGGRIRDSVFFSVIDSEWPQVKARLEERLGT
jgi:RimJ/RimL family protein N-acetyltransferase